MRKYIAVSVTLLAILGYLVIHFTELEPTRKLQAILIMFGIAWTSLVAPSLEFVVQSFFRLSARARWAIFLITTSLVGVLGCMEIIAYIRFRDFIQRNRLESKYEELLSEAIAEVDSSSAKEAKVHVPQD
jgi:hypothetical protein